MFSTVSSPQDDIKTTTGQLGSSDAGKGAGVSGGRATTKESRGTGRSQGELQGAKPPVRKYSASELAAEVTALVRTGALVAQHYCRSPADTKLGHLRDSVVRSEGQGIRRVPRGQLMNITRITIYRISEIYFQRSAICC